MRSHCRAGPGGVGLLKMVCETFTKISTRRFFIRAGMARFARIVVRDYPHRSRSGTQARPADRAPRARTRVKTARAPFAFLIPAHCVSCRRIKRIAYPVAESP
jgi:hypothetical protein